jgi:hypothetical protein
MASERIQVKGQKDQFGKIEIVGFTQFIKAIKNAEDEGRSEKLITKANEQVADVIIRRANKIAGTKMEKAAAASLQQSSSRLRVAVIGGGKEVPYFGGANFGANRNTRRLIKSPSKQRGRRSRATTVRHGEDVDVVVKRVENQSVESNGKTISKRLGGSGVEVARTKSGAVRVIRGWNQFKQSRKGRDFFLYRAVGHEEEHIMGLYQTVIDRITEQGFND